MEIQQVYERWLANVDDKDKKDVAALGDDSSLMEDAFYRDLEFGTAGLRGIIGMGSNRMNVYTVARATQGLANYLNAHFEDPSVAICRDSRNMGEIFVQTAAGVLAANGIHSYLYPRIEPTPALSFAVRDLKCSAGINITASHNPAEYNGYKVYGPDGCQITTDAAHEIQEAINSVDIFDDVRQEPFDRALMSKISTWIGEDTLDRFVEAVLSQSLDESSAKGLSIVYTPLNGTGLECVMRTLKEIGVEKIDVVPEQADPDGNFTTCPYPNPEIREALQKGLELCEKVKPDLLLATDPDADRVGIAVPHAGEYKLLSGNEVGVLLLDYICSRRQARGEDLSRSVAITTIVSSTMADAVASHYGVQLRRTLTGFKYIGEQIGILEANGEADRFIFGFEESYGYLAGSHVRDKDAVVASMLICQMAKWHKDQGHDLYEAMQLLYERYGHYGNSLVNVSYPGSDGAQKMASIMSGLRSNPPAAIAGMQVQSVVDYSSGAQMPVLNGGTDEPQRLPEANVIEFALGEGTKVIIRPSGTEPKIKSYLFAKANSAGESEKRLEDLEAFSHEILG
ncbi:MAG: phospho-sugar mutase [Coriobacteriales bacterium]|jgi:phosphoglucomutase